MNGRTNETVFVSYARADVDRVDELIRRLEPFDHGCFYDREMLGGEAWWQAITDEIVARPAFLFVVSPDSVRSRACRAELRYAAQLGKAVLPVMIRETRVESAPEELQATNFLRFINPADEDWARLDAALDHAEAMPWPALPSPLPERPPPPIADLTWARERVADEALSPDAQRDLLAKLSVQLDHDDDRPAVVAVLQQLVDNPNVVGTVGREASSLIARYRDSPRDQQSVMLLKSVVRAVERERCVPILGSGMTDWLVGTRRELARQWARQYHYPLNLGRRDDLAQVAQYVSVTATEEHVREDLGAFYRERMKSRFPHVVRGPVDGPSRLSLDEILVDVWKAESLGLRGEGHRVLAQMPCRIYVTAQPASLLSVALRAEGKEPRQDVCRWNREMSDDWPESPFDLDRSYEPTVDEPLVYHIFGTLDHPESIVISEDDYFSFLTAVAEEPHLIPTRVTEAIAESSLLFLGFELHDWDMRILLRALINREVAETLGRKHKHVAAEIDMQEGARSPDEAREYLRRYYGMFRQPPIDIFWASTESFCEALETAWNDPESRVS